MEKKVVRNFWKERQSSGCVDFIAQVTKEYGVDIAHDVKAYYVICSTTKTKLKDLKEGNKTFGERVKKVFRRRYLYIDKGHNNQWDEYIDAIETITMSKQCWEISKWNLTSQVDLPKTIKGITGITFE
jgi:hypothetical protein